MDSDHRQTRSVRDFRSGLAGLALLALLLPGLTGCSGMREKPQFSMGLESTPQDQRLMFPRAADGEVPRYVYMGELRGETNISRPEEFGKGFANSIFRMLDIIAGPAAPLVLDRPQSGTVDSQDRVFVTDIGRGSVFMFDEKVPEVKTWFKAEGLTDFISPVGIALGPEGQIFVADADLGLVARLGPGGETLPSIGRGHLQRPNGVAFDPVNSKIYVADTTAHQVKIFNMEGNLLAELGAHGDEPGEFNYPTHIVISHEKLYVTDTMNARVQVFSTRTGAYLATLGKRGMVIGNFSRPKGIAVDSEENIYVVESYFDYLLIFNRRGQFLMPLGGTGAGPGELHLPSGVWIDSRNRVYVADMLNSRVAVFQFLGGGSENE
jgi:DNA-binding beta-propeller fold protein YncE